ncbi:M23 family metallopeptidase [Flavobacterium sp.]|uniref:M23 family metallopeptidase n=1 Tax=Flavobacterium sp. TaxID=239 RepID=UPI003D0B3C4A
MRNWWIPFCFSMLVQAQDKYPKDYFGSPLDINLSIAGSFGELRPNHFHSGIDFRTQQKEGFPVYATADGFISRINVSNFGYGKCLYIDHPNGFTSVYAHLQRFSPTVDKVARNHQYMTKSYTIELRPDATVIPVKKGDLIGYTGNTGGSSGPHLHFEIRNTISEFAINPYLFGYDKQVKDTKKPIINGLMVYPFSENGVVNGSQNPMYVPLTLEEDGTYLASKIEAKGKIGFAINAHDISDYNFGKNGIYKLEASLNGVPHFAYDFETFSFDESKHINCFIDFPRYKKTHQRYQKLFVGYVFPESIIKLKKDDGLIEGANNLSFTYKLEIQDFHGNKNIVNIPISFTELPIKEPKTVAKTPYFLKSQNEQLYEKDRISVFIPEQTFYEDFYLNFGVKNNQLTLHDESVAVSKPMTITFNVKAIAEKDREKMFIGNLDDGKTEYNATTKKDSTFVIKTKKLGKFLLAKDTIAPKIFAPNFKEGENLDKRDSLKIFISDNLSGIREFNAYLNGAWILMEYENKLNRLIHYFSDNKYQDGKNDFKLVVTDNLGNTTTFESNFYKTKL